MATTTAITITWAEHRTRLLIQVPVTIPTIIIITTAAMTVDRVAAVLTAVAEATAAVVEMAAEAVAVETESFHPSSISSSTFPKTIFQPGVTHFILFFQQLRYWTWHCALCATPSFVVASYWMKLPITPMVAAIATFVLLFTVATTVLPPLADSRHILSRALKLGTRVRAWISVFSIFFVFSERSMIYTPDYWCGVAAVLATSQAGLGSISQGLSPRFSEIYLTTLLEGFILSFILLLVSFACLIFLQARDRKKWVAASGNS